MLREFRSTTLLTLLTGLLLSSGPAWVTPAGAGTVGGRACSAMVNAPLLGVAPTFLADTGDSVTPGGSGSDLLEAALPGVLGANVLTATTSVETGYATSSASLADVIVLQGQPAELTASFVRAQADVLDAQGTRKYSGVTEIRDLRFGGQTVAISGQPNQTVDLPGIATLIINEQSTSNQGGVPTLTVNALRLVLATGDQVLLASARSALDKQTTQTLAGLPKGGDRGGHIDSAVYRGRDRLARPRALFVWLQPECKDFVTGGGWFEPRFEGGPPERINFGFNAGFRTVDGPLLGHVNVVDHNDGTHIKGVNVDTYFRLGDPQSLCRMFEGDAEMNGTPGFRYHVEVCDYGEPGRDDRIRIMVFGADGSEVYFADDSSSAKTCNLDEPRCGDLDGGNIQLHKNCDRQAASSSGAADVPRPQI